MQEDEVREFMTGWFGPGFEPMPMLAWSVRKRASLMGSAKSKRHVPAFRPFDLLAEANQSLLVFENAAQRIGVESVTGAQAEFVRHLDFNTLYFQFCGTAKVETECGLAELHPGELMLVPEGIAHRTSSEGGSLRWYFHLHEPIRAIYGEEKETSRTAFEVGRVGGPHWSTPSARRDAETVERMIAWHHCSPEEHTLARRDPGLVGATSRQRDKAESLVRVIRAFDCFTEITGQRGPGPKLIATDNFALETYNTVGAQFAFHRGLESDEFGFQFAGGGYNLSELDAKIATPPGTCALVPLGIAHSVLCDPGFLRFVAYSRIPWETRVDASRHAHESRFEVTKTVLTPHAWMSEKPAAPPHA